MRKSRYSEEKIIRVLQQVESGQKVKDVIREHGISEQTYYRWKSKYGGMSVSEAKRLKALETENKRLKKLVADLSLDKQMLQEVIDRKW
jgi:putative transposase